MSVTSAKLLILYTVLCRSLCWAFNQTNSFSLSDAMRQVKYCGAAYCTDPSFKSSQVQDWNCNACKSTPYVQAKVFSGGVADANGFVGYEKRSNTIIVAFSGTEAVSKRNWIEDFEFVMIPYSRCRGCKVHSGFYLTMMSVLGQIKEFTAALLSANPAAKIVVTGHSLGAALASLTIAELSSDEAFKPSMITTGHYVFGSPRIGNDPFAEWYASKASLTFRINHGQDPVPHVPLQVMGFHHVRYEVTNRSLCMNANQQQSWRTACIKLKQNK